jgi:nuclear pore complex protein Nup210
MVFDDWWDRSWHAALEQQKKGLNSLVVLGAWVLWTHHNFCVFDGAAPSITRALIVNSEEQRLWEIVGTRSLSSFLPRQFCLRVA